MKDFKIVIVDDEESLLLNMKEYFSEYDITIFTDANLALQEMKRQRIATLIWFMKMIAKNRLVILIMLS